MLVGINIRTTFITLHFAYRKITKTPLECILQTVALYKILIWFYVASIICMLEK